MNEIYNIILTPYAENNIDHIINYLEENASEQVADKVKKGIFNAIKGLEKMPERHGILQLVTDKEITYRRVLKWSYKIIFHIKASKKQVIIVDLTHSKQNPQQLISRLSE